MCAECVSMHWAGLLRDRGVQLSGEERQGFRTLCPVWMPGCGQSASGLTGPAVGWPAPAIREAGVWAGGKESAAA